MTARAIGNSAGYCFGAVISTALCHLVGYFGVFIILAVFTFLSTFFLFIF